VDLEGARIAVTGAGGFIGRATAARLREAGADVVGLDLRDGPDVRACDVRDAAAVARALDGADGVVHAAATVAETGAMADFVAVNVRGTANVLRAAGDAKVVQVSSVATWGYAFAEDLHDEDEPVRATGAPYIDTKAASQRLALRHGAAVVRPGDVYGPGSQPWTVRPVQLMARGRFALPAPGDGVMTPVYVDDLVDGLVRALAHEGAHGRAYTCWDGTPVPAREFFGHYARLLGQDGVRLVPRPVLAVAARAAELADRARGRTPELGAEGLTYLSRRAAYPNARAREELGWTPQVALEDGMARTAAWLREAGLVPR
jgi:nucleoside-diphosphate-sugar epimerase